MDLDKRYQKLSAYGDPLERLNEEKYPTASNRKSNVKIIKILMRAGL